MSSRLNPDLPERRAYPYAVGTRLPTDSTTEYTHFNNVGAAAFFASLFTPDVAITKWVAITEPEYHVTAVVPGWRQVTWFAGEMPPADN